MKTIFTALGIIWMATAHSQGLVDGFFKGKGNLDLALSGFTQNSSIYFAGDTRFDYKRNLAGAGLFGALGLRNDLDLIASIPFINGKFQDAGVFIKYCIPHSRFAKERRLILIPALGFSFPMSNYETQSGQAIGQQAVQIQPKLASHWTTRHGIYFTAQAGYNYNFDPVPSSFSASFKTAFSGNKWYMDFWYDYQKGFGDVIWVGGVSQDFRTLYVDYSKIGGGIFYGIKPRFGLFLNGSYVLAGTNVGNAWSVAAGVVWKLEVFDKG